MSLTRSRLVVVTKSNSQLLASCTFLGHFKACFLWVLPYFIHNEAEVSKCLTQLPVSH